jgi:hypothetical protein
MQIGCCGRLCAFRLVGQALRSECEPTNPILTSWPLGSITKCANPQRARFSSLRLNVDARVRTVKSA